MEQPKQHMIETTYSLCDIPQYEKADRLPRNIQLYTTWKFFHFAGWTQQGTAKIVIGLPQPLVWETPWFLAWENLACYSRTFSLPQLEKFLCFAVMGSHAPLHTAWNRQGSPWVGSAFSLGIPNSPDIGKPICPGNPWKVFNSISLNFLFPFI